jgi:hypothetical protein
MLAKFVCIICTGVAYAWVLEALDLSFDWRSFALALVIGAALWFSFARPVSSWLYVRLRLGVGLSWSEAVLASVLLSPVRDMGRWTPMLHLRKLDRSARRQALVSHADKLVRYYRGCGAQWRSAPTKARVLRVLLWCGLVASCSFAFIPLPPFSWLNSIYPAFVRGGIGQLLNLLLACMPFVLALEALERRYGIESARFTGWTRVRQVNTQRSGGDSSNESTLGGPKGQ